MRFLGFAIMERKMQLTPRPMAQDFDRLVRDSLTAACEELVPPPAFESTCCPSPSEALRMAALICFSGPNKTEGTFGIATTLAGAERIRAHLNSPDSLSGRADALCELANLVAGHLRRAWSRYGVVVSLSTPMLVRGVALTLGHEDDCHRFAHQSGIGADRLALWIDLHGGANVELLSEPSEVGVLDGGEMRMH